MTVIKNTNWNAENLTKAGGDPFLIPGSHKYVEQVLRWVPLHSPGQSAPRPSALTLRESPSPTAPSFLTPPAVGTLWFQVSMLILLPPLELCSPHQEGSGGAGNLQGWVRDISAFPLHHPALSLLRKKVTSALNPLQQHPLLCPSSLCSASPLSKHLDVREESWHYCYVVVPIHCICWFFPYCVSLLRHLNSGLHSGASVLLALCGAWHILFVVLCWNKCN